MEQYKQLILVVCDHAFEDKSGKMSIIGMFEDINLLSVPGGLLKMVVVGSYKIIDEIPEKVKLEVGIKKPDGSLLIQAKIDSASISNNNTFNFLIALENLKFDTLGEYIVEVVVNGAKIGEKAINVKKILN